MSRQRRRKSKGNAGHILGGTLLMLTTAGIGGGVWYLHQQAEAKPVLDKVTLCPTTGPKDITAILLDVTDPISDITALDLRNHFQELVAAVPTGGLIEVYTLTDTASELDKSFSGCNPGDASTVSDWTGNKRLVQERWEKGFQKPLDEIAGRVNQGVGGKQSPILAGIQKINVAAFGAKQYKDIPKHLVIASDLIEHTPTFSMYSSGVDYSKFKRSGAPDQFRTDLTGITVRLFHFQRPGGKFDSYDLAEFWKTWVMANGGDFDKYTRLEGIL
ncbi:hypothetical protein Rleg10DRAFT_5598 [Rhizobium leguminosarum bv. trifolii WSM2012]|nr:hypothetical protein Rleg10DRAFT_4387 [Rhizobium leguminosarum bv. trifolii WSM2012]EJC76908.1 hypothetical protein Rleg10DRAFT_5598 [Rhizobium leguminosarum bv. trifolii WSM2012]